MGRIRPPHRCHSRTTRLRERDRQPMVGPVCRQAGRSPVLAETSAEPLHLSPARSRPRVILPSGPTAVSTAAAIGPAEYGNLEANLRFIEASGIVRDDSEILEI